MKIYRRWRHGRIPINIEQTRFITVQDGLIAALFALGILGVLFKMAEAEA